MASSSEKRRYFISGVMIGSKHKLVEVEKDLHNQDYRARLAEIICRVDPQAEIVDPLDIVKAFAESKGISLDDLNLKDSLVAAALDEIVAIIPSCHVIISNLPEASMGSAVELWEAKRSGLLIFTVSPMTSNWTIRAVAKRNFQDFDDLEQNLAKHL
ncbi:unnamed protein product [Polarella glacialis]|uniref:Uncharacterized protein n=1 Tax=Polarella glacialis TaxID=89957 RepID=A0A813DKA9_POLGL|nr:unnamed protein product [Polarella glacialis]CAE8624822.1 unnamed protein product [Polarella glacialis]